MGEKLWEWQQSEIEKKKDILDNLLYNFFKERNETNRAWAEKQAFLDEFNKLSDDDKKIYLNYVVDKYLKWNCNDSKEFEDLVEWMSSLNKMEIYATLRNACSISSQQPNMQQNWNWWSPVTIYNNIQVPWQQQWLDQNDVLPNVINIQISWWRIYWNWDWWKDYDDALRSVGNVQISRWETKQINLDFKNRRVDLTITYWNDWVMYFKDSRWRKASYFVDQNDDDRRKKLILWQKVPNWTQWYFMELDISLNLNRQRHYQQPIWPGWRNYRNPNIQWWADEFYWNQFRSR